MQRERSKRQAVTGCTHKPSEFSTETQRSRSESIRKQPRLRNLPKKQEWNYHFFFFFKTVEHREENGKGRSEIFTFTCIARKSNSNFWMWTLLKEAFERLTLPARSPRSTAPSCVRQRSPAGGGRFPVELEGSGPGRGCGLWVGGYLAWRVLPAISCCEVKPGGGPCLHLGREGRYQEERGLPLTASLERRVQGDGFGTFGWKHLFLCSSAEGLWRDCVLRSVMKVGWSFRSVHIRLKIATFISAMTSVPPQWLFEDESVLRDKQ